MGSNKNERIKNHVPLELDKSSSTSLKNAKKCEKAGATSYKKVSVIFSEKKLTIDYIEVRLFKKCDNGGRSYGGGFGQFCKTK